MKDFLVCLLIVDGILAFSSFLFYLTSQLLEEYVKKHRVKEDGFIMYLVEGAEEFAYDMLFSVILEFFLLLVYYLGKLR